MASQRDLKFINGGSKLTFDAGTGFAINPQSESAIAFAGDFRNQVLIVAGTGTVVVYGSCQKTPPDFTSASTIDNAYVAIVLADYSTQNTYYNGTAGVAVSASTKMVELNTNVLTWIAIHRSANTVDVKLTEADNQ